MIASVLVQHLAAWLCVGLSMLLPAAVLVSRFCWPERMPWLLAIVLLVLTGPGLGWATLGLEQSVLESLSQSAGATDEISAENVAAVIARAAWPHGTFAW